MELYSRFARKLVFQSFRIRHQFPQVFSAWGILCKSIAKWQLSKLSLIRWAITWQALSRESAMPSKRAVQTKCLAIAQRALEGIGGVLIIHKINAFPWNAFPFPSLYLNIHGKALGLVLISCAYIKVLSHNIQISKRSSWINELNLKHVNQSI